MHHSYENPFKSRALLHSKRYFRIEGNLKGGGGKHLTHMLPRQRIHITRLASPQEEITRVYRSQAGTGGPTVDLSGQRDVNGHVSG